MTEEAQQILSIMSNMLQIGGFIFLFSHILKRRLPFLAVWGIECAVQLIISCCYIFFDIPATVRFIFQQALALGGLLLLFEGKIAQKILCCAALDLISLVSSIISAFIINNFWETNMSILLPHGADAAITTFLTSDILMAIIFLICWVMLFRKYHKGNMTFAKSQVGIFLLIIIIHYGFMLVHYRNRIYIDSFDILMNYIFQIIIIFSLFLVYFSARKNIDLMEENHLLSIKQSEQESEQRYYELAQAKFDDISKIRHDLNNKLAVAKQLILDDQKNEAQEIMEDIFKSLGEIKAVQYCSVPLINTILTTKANEPVYKSIDMQFLMKDCHRMPCDTSEICSLFSNLFDNAAGAALESGKEPMLQMESGAVNEYFVLKIINTAKSRSIPDGIYTVSTKNRSGHGYGLSIIAMIAEKYGGSFTLEQEGDYVTASVFLKIST